MQALRNWLLGIVKQAIREDALYRELRGGDARIAGAMRGVVGDNPDAVQFMGGKPMNAVWPVNPDSRKGIETHAEPVSFEQLQDAALKDQDAYWTKKTPSDL